MRLDRLLSLPEEELPPKDDLYKAVHYLDSEWKAMEGIFTRGDTALDNNLREQQNRYVFKSGRNSLFLFPTLSYREVKAVIKPKTTPGAFAKASGRSRFSLKSP